MKSDRLQVISFFSFGIGNLFLIISRIFNDGFDDFMIGVLEGIYMVLVIFGTLGLVYSIFSKKGVFNNKK